MFLKELFPNSKVKDHSVVEKYKVIDPPSNLRMRDFVQMFCVDCKHTFRQRANNIFSQGIISCKCSKSYRKTEGELKDILLEYCYDNNLTLDSIEYLRPMGKSCVNLTCDTCRKSTKTTYESIVFQGAGCIHCNKKYKRTKEEHMEEVSAALLGRFNWSAQLPDRPTTKTLVNLTCVDCGKEQTRSISSILYQKSECMCNAAFGYDQKRAGYIYLIKLYNEVSEFYKVGVTYNLKQRFSQLSKNNNLLVEVISTWYYPPNSPILSHELYLKNNFGIGRVDPKPFSDGYTEIVDGECLPILISLQNLQYRTL